MKFWAVIMSRRDNHAVCGEYFDHAVDAWKYAKPDCGYYGAIVVYKNGCMVKEIERGRA